MRAAFGLALVVRVRPVPVAASTSSRWFWTSSRWVWSIAELREITNTRALADAGLGSPLVC
jgi:hypothetical protein